MRRPALLAVALATLALFFGWKTRDAWRSSTPAVDNTGQAAADLWHPGEPVPDPPPPAETAGTVAAIAARPLFRPDRLPYNEQGPGASAGRNYESELSRLALIGTLTFGGDLKGIVVSKGSSLPERWEVKAGDQLPGFTVKEVQIDGLALTADGREFMLPLYAGAPTSAGRGSVRTELPRKDAASVQQPAAAPPLSAVQPPPSGSPPAPPPAFIPERSPSRPPRYYPRRR
jgi:hypothetical protein